MKLPVKELIKGHALTKRCNQMYSTDVVSLCHCEAFNPFQGRISGIKNAAEPASKVKK